MMDAIEARERYVEMLMDHVRGDRFPSNDHMNRIEAALTPATAGDYLEMLMDKIGAEHYPSTSMLKRIENIASQLPERRRSRREPEDDEDAEDQEA
jgi:uncharacterized protein (DUF2342 family)